jgi:lipopolysaccharide/colanic/teichoic acid biosynthesis glycosyltransferase
VHDVFHADANENDIIKRFEFLKNNYAPVSLNKSEIQDSYKMPKWKRIFDILFASTAIILLSPLFLLITLLIRLESKGKVFYTAPRVGTGYETFGFYKFRSMYSDADKKVESMMDKNQYKSHFEEEEPFNNVVFFFRLIMLL